VRGLRGSGVSASALREPGLLNPGGRALVLGPERCGQLSGACFDLGGPLGELAQQSVVDAVDLECRGAVTAAVAM
jgi:hypothetical protein